MFGLHEILKYAHSKFTVYGRKYTYTQLPPNAVMLVWGLLRLAPITEHQGSQWPAHLKPTPSAISTKSNIGQQAHA